MLVLLGIELLSCGAICKLFSTSFTPVIRFTRLSRSALSFSVATVPFNVTTPLSLLRLTLSLTSPSEESAFNAARISLFRVRSVSVIPWSCTITPLVVGLLGSVEVEGELLIPVVGELPILLPDSEDEPAVPGLAIVPECESLILDELGVFGDVTELLPVESEDELLPAD